MIHRSRARILLRIHRRSTRKVESGRYRLSFSKSRDAPLTRTQTQDPFVRQRFAPACSLLQDTGLAAFMLGALALGAAPLAAQTRGDPARGRQVFERYCMQCHGDRGDGAGEVARWSQPKPRDFRQGVFKFSSTPYGSLPTTDDLDRVIEDGLYGTRTLRAAKGGMRVPYRPSSITRSRSSVVGREPYGVELNLKTPCRKSRGFGCDQRATSPAPSPRSPWHCMQ